MARAWMAVAGAIALAASLLAAVPPSAAQASCAAAAAQVARQTGGRVVSVTRSARGCEVRVVVPGRNGRPPRSQVVTVPG